MHKGIAIGLMTDPHNPLPCRYNGLESGSFVYAMIPQYIDQAVIAKMTSVPQSVKIKLLNVLKVSLKFHTQFIIVDADGYATHFNMDTAPVDGWCTVNL